MPCLHDEAPAFPCLEPVVRRWGATTLAGGVKALLLRHGKTRSCAGGVPLLFRHGSSAVQPPWEGGFIGVSHLLCCLWDLNPCSPDHEAHHSYWTPHVCVLGLHRHCPARTVLHHGSCSVSAVLLTSPGHAFLGVEDVPDRPERPRRFVVNMPAAMQQA